MMKLSLAAGSAALAFFAATAVGQTAAPLDVRAAMQQRVNPATLAIWDVGNNAMNDEGGIDPAQMDDAKWAQLAKAAGDLSAAGEAMASAGAYLAAAPDNTEVGEGEVPMEAVQKHIDSDPKLFGQMAAAMAAHADKLSAAVEAKDAAAAGDLIAAMDGVCESCHARFWYPEP